MTFGEYKSLLEKEGSWPKLGIGIDSKWFVKYLDEVREMRNEVMHFNQDPFSDEKLNALRKFAAFLRKVRTIRAMRRLQREP
jgi:hypothetical protein